jgi:perosamine synthetase
MGQIPLTKPHLTAHDEKEILSCLRSTWISSKSPYVKQFEEQFAKNVSKTTYAVALNSGTSALFIALKSLGIGPGDEVILPSFTMIATINAVVWTGAKPVLATCTSKQDWSINPDDIEQKITKKTKAIIPVHIYGFTCDMQAICDLARKNGIFVVEDAAEAVGSLYQNKPVGSLGDIGCFSLFSNKIITTGNGGVLTTNNKKVYDMATRLSFFDFNPKDHYLHRLIAFNLVMTGLQALTWGSTLTLRGNQ